MLRTIGRLDAGPASRSRLRHGRDEPPAGRNPAGRRCGTPDATFDWHDSLDAARQAPLLIVGNELFDALPFRQFVRKEGQWLERAVGLDDDGRSALRCRRRLRPIRLPCPRKPTMRRTAHRRARARPRGADGGHCRTHRQAWRRRPVLRLRPSAARHRRHAPGHAETSLRRRARQSRRGRPHRACRFFRARRGGPLARASTPILRRRASSCSAWACSSARASSAHGDDAARVEDSPREVERLAGADAMGNLFKVLAILPAGMPAPPFRSAS